jgi:hypothetical protein
MIGAGKKLRQNGMRVESRKTIYGAQMRTSCMPKVWLTSDAQWTISYKIRVRTTEEIGETARIIKIENHWNPSALASKVPQGSCRRL